MRRSRSSFASLAAMRTGASTERPPPTHPGEVASVVHAVTKGTARAAREESAGSRAVHGRAETAPAPAPAQGSARTGGRPGRRTIRPPPCRSSTSCSGTTATSPAPTAPSPRRCGGARSRPSGWRAEIDRAAARGFTEVAFTGGEPTIRRDLPALVKHARRRGFEHVKVASNGLRYAHAPYLEHLVACGVDRFHVSMHARGDEAYEATVRREDTAPLRRAAIENLVARGLDPVADLILKEDTYRDARAWIADLHALGVRRFALWLVSLTDQNAGNVAQLPRLPDVARAIAPAFDDARRGGYEVVSLHVPALLPARLRGPRAPPRRRPGHGGHAGRGVRPQGLAPRRRGEAAGLRRAAAGPTPARGCAATTWTVFGGDEVRAVRWRLTERYRPGWAGTCRRPRGRRRGRALAHCPVIMSGAWPCGQLALRLRLAGRGRRAPGAWGAGRGRREARAARGSRRGRSVPKTGSLTWPAGQPPPPAPRAGRRGAAAAAAVADAHAVGGARVARDHRLGDPAVAVVAPARAPAVVDEELLGAVGQRAVAGEHHGVARVLDGLVVGDHAVLERAAHPGLVVDGERDPHVVAAGEHAGDLVGVGGLGVELLDRRRAGSGRWRRRWRARP